MNADLWIQVVSDHGISAAIAFYLLHRMEKKLDMLIYTVHQTPPRSASHSEPHPSPSSPFVKGDFLND